VDSPPIEEDAQRAAQQALIGQVLGGRYTITKLLGEGGMGAVFVGEQKLGGTIRKVAIKTLHPHLSHDPKILARFERECGTIAELQHPNTIQVYDFGKTDNGLLYIAMEFVEGRSVAEILEKEGPMAPARVLKILEQICGSLEEAHGRGIVHRDLKPDNIVLCERAGQKDWVEVLDFGIAKRSSEEDKEEQKLTQQGMVLGTPPYMSPEQFTGKPVDARSDIYSLGVMTYEMLTGKLPFTGNTAWEWATQHMTAMPQPFEAQPMGKSVPADMRHAVEKSLAKLPEDRFANVREFIDAFSGRSPVVAASASAGTGTAQHGQVDPHAVAGHAGAPPFANQPPAAGSPPRGKTEIGAPIDAMPYGAAPQQGVGYGASPPGPPMGVAPAGSGYGTPASGNQAFASNHQAYGNTAAQDGGGGKRGLLIAVLGVALLGCVGLVLAASGVFSSKKTVTPLGGGTDTTTPATNTVVAPPDTTPTTPTTPATLPTLAATTPKPTSVTPVAKPDAGHAATPPTTPTTAPTTPPTTAPTTAPTTPPTTAPTTPPVPTPSVKTEPAECAQARMACAGAGIAQRAACGQLKKACFDKGGKL
jgi:serine/threonine-protein kinase